MRRKSVRFHLEYNVGNNNAQLRVDRHVKDTKNRDKDKVNKRMVCMYVYVCVASRQPDRDRLTER